ncbi:MAG TPA: hypothetical protein VFS29_04400 [Motilibacteraceae bacterium]|nr:hypothetical protein [Motilibacteraceae bacterium]
MRDAAGAGEVLRVEPSALLEAAARCRTAAEGLRGQADRMRGAVPPVGDRALHDVADQLATRLTRLLAAESGGARAVHEALTTAAARYVEVDRTAVPRTAGPCVGPVAPISLGGPR